MTVAFSHLVVHVRDLRRARRFYEGLLGPAGVGEDATRLRLDGGDGAHIEIEERPGHGQDVGAAGIEIVLRVPDVDVAFAQLRAAGIELTAPTDQRSGGRHAWLHDPDGYRLSIYSPSA